MSRCETKTTPLMRQYNAVKAKHPDKIVFFRMGDFYEMFGDDAVRAAPLLGIALTTRGQSGSEKIPLAGVPYHAADKYLARLIKAGQKVVVVEQVEDPKTAKGVVKREVVEILTPGSAALDDAEHTASSTYLAAVSPGPNGRAGMAYLDLATAEFRLVDGENMRVADRLAALAPREVLAPENMSDEKLRPLLGGLEESVTHSRSDGYHFDPQSGAEEMRRFFDVTSLEGFGVSESDMSVGAAAAIVRYLKDNQRQNLGHITRLSAIKAGEFMELDQSSARNLELVESLSKTDGPSLFAAVNRTLTSPGARRLRRNLLAPFCKRDTILRRQSAIDDTLHRPDSARATQELLRRLPDLERLVGKLGTLRISPRQTRALARALETGYDIIVSIDASSSELFTGFVARYPGELKEAGKRLAERLVEEPPLVSSGGGIFRPGASAELDSLNGSISSARSYLATLQQQEREATGIPSLKLGFNKIFGYYLEVTNTHKDKIPERYLRKQTLVNAERYITEEMKEQERLIQQAEERIFSLEKELFEQALEELSTHICDIQLATDMLAEIDVVTALAELARERGYCRPTITEAGELRITAGRHPVIETILPRGSFVPNDIELDNSTQRLMILTGPNMAGKSTYLRQIGHIVVLAQIGSYVPAESATIGLVDRIFTRVGAVDKLAQGQSTFMVEMLETANILNNGDENSLILLDEVGRGTSTFDGLSLAWAIVEEIDERLKARTVFATHYHELTALAAERNHVVNYQVAVKRWSDRIIFLHRIVPGGCDDSYGIEVSRLAGLPNNVVARAGEILKMMESGQLISSRTHSGLSADRQTSLFDRSSGAETPVDTALNEIADRLREMRTEEMTPLEALTELDSLSKRIKGD